MKGISNPTVTLKLGDAEILQVDLWQLVMVYAPKKAVENWNSLKLYLDDKEVSQGK